MLSVFLVQGSRRKNEPGVPSADGASQRRQAQHEEQPLCPRTTAAAAHQPAPGPAMRIAAHALTRRLTPRACCLVWSQNASRAFTAARAMPAARPLTVRGFHCRQQHSRKNSRRVGQALRLWGLLWCGRRPQPPAGLLCACRTCVSTTWKSPTTRGLRFPFSTSTALARPPPRPSCATRSVLGSACSGRDATQQQH